MQFTHGYWTTEICTHAILWHPCQGNCSVLCPQSQTPKTAQHNTTVFHLVLVTTDFRLPMRSSYLRRIYTYKGERNANSSRYSAANFPVFPYYRITTVHAQHTLHIRWLRIRSTGRQVCGKPHFHNALTIVRAAPDWPTLVVVHMQNDSE